MYKSRFCKVKGDTKKARLLERVYDGLDGGIRDTPWDCCENLWQSYSPGKQMFECGPSWYLRWSIRTDNPGFFVGFLGWLPFLEPILRVAYRNTLRTMCRPQREDGCYPIYPLHAEYKTEQDVIAEWGLQRHRVDDYIDGHLAAIINQCEAMLFTRDIQYAKKRIPSLRRAMDMAEKRTFKDGLMEVGYGGAFIELWYSYEGYPSSTQIFFIKALSSVAEVERLLGNEEEAERRLALIPGMKAALKKLITPEGYFIGAVDTQGRNHGDGSDYYESIPNVIAGPLEVIGVPDARKICRRIAEMPELNTVPMVVNYPARWEEMHPKVAARGVGSHWNGGAWLGIGGFEVWTHLMAGEYSTAEELVVKMMDHRDIWGLQDFVPNFGHHPGVNVFKRRPCDHPIHFQHGACGNTLRGLLGVQVRHDAILLSPRIFPEIESVSFTRPIYYGKKQLFVSVRNGERLREAKIDGSPVEISEEGVLLPYDALKTSSLVHLEFGS